MSGEGEYCCYIGGLAFSTSERGLKEAFEKFGRLVDAKVVIDKLNGRSRGFGFVTFDERKAMEEAIEAMNGMDLDGRNIIVERAQTSASSRDQDGGRDRGRDRRDYGGGRGSNGGDCFKCGKPGHFARECPSEGGGGNRYGGRDDRYGGRDDRYGGRDDRYGGRDDRYGGRDDRYGGRDDRYGGEDGGRFGPDRNGDRAGGRSRDFGNRGGSGNDRYNRDRAGPYERRGSGSGNYR